MVGYRISLRFLFSSSFGLTSSDIVEGLSVFVSELEQRRLCTLERTNDIWNAFSLSPRVFGKKRFSWPLPPLNHIDNQLLQEIVLIICYMGRVRFYQSCNDYLGTASLGAFHSFAPPQGDASIPRERNKASTLHGHHTYS